MARPIFFIICIVSLTAGSCNTNVKTDHKVPEKERELSVLISRYPDSVLLKENLVQYFRENGKYEQAIKETEKVLKRDSLNTRFLDIKATLYFENGDTANAIKSFEKAVSIDPQPEYIMSLGSLYAQTKNPGALVMADELINVSPANARTRSLFIKGLYYNYTGDKIKAIPFFDSCLKIDYRDLLAYREKAICLYDLNKYTEALDVLNQAMTVQKNFDEGYYWMGRCYEKLGKRKEAIESFQLALRLDTGYVDAKEALGRMGIK